MLGLGGGGAGTRTLFMGASTWGLRQSGKDGAEAGSGSRQAPGRGRERGRGRRRRVGLGYQRAKRRRGGGAHPIVGFGLGQP